MIAQPAGWLDLAKKNSEYKFLGFLLMPDDISIQVSGSIGTISGSVGLKFDPFKPVGNQTPPADPIAGCGSEPYVAPTSTVPTAFWFWDNDHGTPPGDIKPYEFQWGNFDQSAAMAGNKPARKKDIFTDLTTNNSNELKVQAGARVDSILDLNNSYFGENQNGVNKYFQTTYIYSDDMSLVYSLKELGHGIDEIAGQRVVYFADENSAEFVTGTILSDGSGMKTDSGNVIKLPNVTDNVHLEASFEFIGYWLNELKQNGISADFLFSTTLSGNPADPSKGGDGSLPWTTNAMRKAGRYNAYAEKNNTPKYEHFNIDTEPGPQPKLQAEYLEVNDAITGLFGPGSPSGFDFPIAGYVNQQQFQGTDPFAGKVADNSAAESMIFASYRSTPKAQCDQYDTIKNMPRLGKGKHNKWSIAWEGSNTPVGVKTPPSPLINQDDVINMRKMADIAIAQFGDTPFPLQVNDDPMVAISSFTPVYAQIVHGQDGLG